MYTVTIRILVIVPSPIENLCSRGSDWTEVDFTLSEQIHNILGKYFGKNIKNVLIFPDIQEVNKPSDAKVAEIETKDDGKKIQRENSVDNVTPAAKVSTEKKVSWVIFTLKFKKSSGKVNIFDL